MKKALLLFAICFAAVGIARAQSNNNLINSYLFPLKPIAADTSINGLLRSNKANPKDLLKALANKTADVHKPEYDNTIYSTMPVAGLSNKNQDSMPVVKLGDANTKYTMLVKRIGIAKPAVAAAADNQANADTDKK